MSDMGDCCDDFEAQALEARQRKVLVTVLLINLATFVMMVAASVHSGSSALLSGTLDNLGDALTYALSLATVGAATVVKARVALFKGMLISLAAIVVASQIIWRLQDPTAPIVETMGAAALLNLLANLACLALLTPHRHEDVNMASVWECSRNDVYEGVAVIVTTALVWITSSGWPDILVATVLLVLFARSALRVLRSAWQNMQTEANPT